ncbi:MAG TPA: MFS transporter [Steroidobacteraceae bacterium]|nr:MFS transporter [Steroidobacteraceae bacterium]
MDRTHNVAVLTVAQALAASGMTVMPVLGGIVGAQLAPRPELATLPVSLAVVGLAATTMPAALLMRRIGRRAGFTISALFAALAALLACWAIVGERFAVFCVAASLLGANAAFTLQYRFAAAESVPPEHVSRAVSTVMIGTLAAAWLGPEIALLASHVVSGHEFAGSFIAVAGMYVLASAVLTLYRPLPEIRRTAAEPPPRPLAAMLSEPAFIVAVLAGVVAYGVMSFIMTATPISMHVIDGHSVDETTWVIQSHLLAMYLPSLVSGRIVARIGTRTTMTIGTLLMVLCVVIDLRGQHLMHYWWGLVLLGIGWNLLFVAGTTQLTTAYHPSERHRAQAVNEFAIFGLQALASLLAGVAIQAVGWSTLNLATLPFLALMLVAIAWAKGPPRWQRAAAD